MTLLHTKNLSLMINKKILFEGLNVTIQSGDIWGILGPNGCGKTTLLHTLGNFRRPDQGEIFLKNTALSRHTTHKISQHIGILFQDSSDTFLQSVFEYCLSGRHPHVPAFHWESSEDKAIARQALALMELENLHTQKVASLSGGERRRLAIATLLTQAPEVYLLDEPTNHLDVYHQIKTLNHFKTLATKGAAILMALHDVNIAQHYCNTILMLFENGEYLVGAPQDILTEDNLLRLYRHPLRRSLRDHWLPCYD